MAQIADLLPHLRWIWKQNGDEAVSDATTAMRRLPGYYSHYACVRETLRVNFELYVDLAKRCTWLDDGLVLRVAVPDQKKRMLGKWAHQVRVSLKDYCDSDSSAEHQVLKGRFGDEGINQDPKSPLRCPPMPSTKNSPLWPSDATSTSLVPCTGCKELQ